MFSKVRNACKNATLSVIFRLIIFSFFSLIFPKSTISEAIKSLHAKENVILIQKGLSLIFKDAG